MPSRRTTADGPDRGPAPTTAEELFAGHPGTLAVFSAVAAAVARLGPVTTRVGRSSVGFARRRGFAWVWRPGQYVRSDVPAVLSLALAEAVHSPRVKEVVHPSTHVFMHHLELADPGEVDEEVLGLVRTAYEQAG